MKKKYYRILPILLILTAVALASSCNKSDEDVAGETPTTTESVAITKFKLNPNISVMKNLDSVYFSIDLVHGVVFNADSLPKGTKITKLVPSITYPSSVTSALITMTGGTNREGTVDYLHSPTDTIDFSGKVTLELKAGDISKTYILKVNVHNAESDTLIWENLAVNEKLPSRLENPKAQKTISGTDGAICLLEENDGTFTLATSTNLFEEQWTKQAVEPGFTPDLNTFTYANNQYFILSNEGALYKSADALGWETCDKTWSNILGGYESYLLGLNAQGNSVSMVSYPEGLNIDNLPEDFPLEGFSSPLVNKSAWAGTSTMMIFGGKDINGTYCNGAWAFDGSRWVNLADRPLPAIYGLEVFPYYSYLTASYGGEREIANLIAMGGTLADGTINRDVYISYNNGISWVKGADYLQLPAEMKIGVHGNVLTVEKEMEWDLSNNWKAVKGRRVGYTIDGDLVKWNCPYIFIFGGYDTEGTLIPDVKCGVLRRLTFAPLF